MILFRGARQSMSSKGSDIKANVIHLNNGPIILSKKEYSKMEEIESDFDNFNSVLGPWTCKEIESYFASDFGEELFWPFKKYEIRQFMDSSDWILPETSGFRALTPSAIALRFNGYINFRNIDGLQSMMTEDHTFIDSANDVHAGKEMMVTGWKEFFDTYPDYRNIFTRLFERGNFVIILGYSMCSYSPLDGPAIWSARIRDGNLSEWRVYLDTKENRAHLQI